VSGVAGQLPRRLMAGVMMLVAVVYLVLTGASPSMLRACTAVWLVLLGRHLWWRPIQPFRLFCYGIILLIALEPQLIGSIAYQLSVAATAGIFVFSRPFLQGSLLESLFTSGVTTLTEHQHSRKSPILTYLKESLIVSCGAQLGVMPLLLYHFQVTSLLGVIATTAVSWMLPALFFSGWVAIGASLFFSAEWLAAPAWVLSSIFVRILQVPEEISSYFQLELEVSLSMVVVMYAALAVLAAWLRRRSSQYKAFQHLELQRGAYA
jgi:competence protein ComEC